MFLPVSHPFKSTLPSGFMTIPAGTVLETGIGRTSLSHSRLKKKKVLPFLIGPPMVPPNCAGYGSRVAGPVRSPIYALMSGKKFASENRVTPVIISGGGTPLHHSWWTTLMGPPPVRP